MAGSAICVATKADQNAGAAEEHPFSWVALAVFPTNPPHGRWQAGTWQRQARRRGKHVE